MGKSQFTTLDQIIQAVDNGETVHLYNTNYKVVKFKNGDYYIKCLSNGHLIGLTHTDGLTLNADINEFFSFK